jgi:hypothetical protein
MGMFLVNYGVTDALAPFPLHSLVTNMTTTINNNTVSMNVQDTLPALLRLHRCRGACQIRVHDPDWAWITSRTIGTGSIFQDYMIDSVGAMGRCKACGLHCHARSLLALSKRPTLSHQQTITTAFRGTRAQSFVSYENNSLAYDQRRPAGSTWYHKPRGPGCCRSSMQLMQVQPTAEDRK